MSGKRNTESERAAIESTAARLKGAADETGRHRTAEEARRMAVRIAEQSDAKRREHGK